MTGAKVNMKKPILVALAIALVVAIVTDLHSQPTAASDPLVVVMKRLREAIERQTATIIRSNALTGRLMVQDQHLARAREHFEQVQMNVRSASVEARTFQRMLSEVQSTLNQETNPAERDKIERRRRALQARMKDHSWKVAELETQNSNARSAFDAEAARLVELESMLTQLEQTPRP